jgi:hypothetical protein
VIDPSLVYPRQRGEADAAYIERLAQVGAPREAAHRKAEHDRAVRGAAEGVRRIQAYRAALAAEAGVSDAEYRRAAEVLAIARAGAEARASMADAVGGVNWCRSSIG